jgi:hypothetical protein
VPSFHPDAFTLTVPERWKLPEGTRRQKRTGSRRVRSEPASDRSRFVDLAIVPGGTAAPTALALLAAASSVEPGGATRRLIAGAFPTRPDRLDTGLGALP